MPESDKTLKILLQVQADVAELAKVNAGLDQLNTKTSQAADSAESLAASLAGGLAAGAIGSAVFVATSLFKAIVDVQQESTRVTEEIHRQSDAVSAQIGTWQELAAAAENFADTIKIGDKIAPQLAQAAAVMAKFRADELSGWDKFVDGVIKLLNKIPSPIIGGSFGSLTTNAGTNAAKLTGSANDLFNSLTAGAQARDAADSAAAAASQLRALPAADAIKILNGQIKDLTQNILDLDAKARPSALAVDPESLAANERAAQQLKTESDTLARKNALLTEISGKQVKTNEQLERTAAAATIIEDKLSGNLPKLAFDTATEKVRQLRTEWQKLGPLNEAQEAALKITFTQTQANVLAQKQHKTASEGTRDAHRDIVAFLTEESALLRENQQQQREIENNPFLTVDQKNTRLLALIPQQISQINAKIAEGKTKIANTVLDPATLARANAAIKQSEARVRELGTKMQTLTFGGQVRASLVEWVNQVGDSAQAVSSIMTNSLTTAVNGVSQAITGAIFQTQSWGQAFAQIAQSIIGNIIQIVLQWAVSRALMALLNIAFGETETAASTTNAEAQAAAWAPAAIAASIASYGAAAGAGNIAFIAALLSGTAFASGLSAGGGGFEQGGYTGYGKVGEVAGLVHRREYVFDAGTVAKGGGAAAFDNLRVAINRPGYERGGAVGGGGKSSGAFAPASRAPEVHVFNFTDQRALRHAYQQSRAAKKFIVDVVNGAGGNLRG